MRPMVTYQEVVGGDHTEQRKTEESCFSSRREFNIS